MSSKLLPPNSTPLERGLADATNHDLPVVIDTLWDPWRCPASHLPWLAWGLHVDNWQSEWTEDAKRRVIATSVHVHRRKGTIGAVKRLLDAVGAMTVVREWYETGGPPHSFEIDVYMRELHGSAPDDPYLGPAMTPRMQRLINDAKALRSRYTLNVGVSFTGALAVGGTIGRPITMVSPLASQALERSGAADEVVAIGAALQRPGVHSSPVGWQDADRETRSTQELHLGAAMPRPAVHVLPIGLQDADRDLQVSPGLGLGATLPRPVIFVTAICNQPGLPA